MLTLQKQALGFINKASYGGHTDPLFKHNGILKLTDIYLLQSAVFIYDSKHSKLPLSSEIFYCSGNVWTTCQSNNVPLPKPRTNFSGGSFYYNVPKIWNNLDITTKLVSNKDCFSEPIKTVIRVTMLSMYHVIIQTVLTAIDIEKNLFNANNFHILVSVTGHSYLFTLWLYCLHYLDGQCKISVKSIFVGSYGHVLCEIKSRSKSRKSEKRLFVYNGASSNFQ